MKKIILKPKVITLVFVFFVILVALIPMITVLGTSLQKNGQPMWQIDADGTQVAIPLKSALGLGSDACVINNSSAGNSYLIPYKTISEWNSFVATVGTRTGLGLTVPTTCCGDGVCNGVESPYTCFEDCAVQCDLQPANVYTSAIYSASRACGSTPACVFHYPDASTVVTSTQVFYSWQTAQGCGVLQKYQQSQCASLLKPNGYICNGNSCITGVDHEFDNDPKFCVGTYDSLLKACVYNNKIDKPLPGWQDSVYIDSYYLYYNSQVYTTTPAPGMYSSAVGTWGTCSTQVTCGDTICSGGYGETCSSCPEDCGACPVDCSAYDKSSTCPSPDCFWNGSLCISLAS